MSMIGDLLAVVASLLVIIDWYVRHKERKDDEP